MHKFIAWIRHHKNLPFVAALLTACLVIWVVNFPFDKWLLGWDNLVPEFNFSKNFERAFFSLWQENEGLGLTGGHGYAATLLHTGVLYLLSFLLPINALRPFFHLFMHTVGGVGCYYLLIHVFRKKPTNTNRVAALLGALFYLFNFATIQMFYIPLEAFSAHFAFLPWLILYLLKFLDKPTRKNVGIYFFICLLSSIQGFIPPLFIVYMMFVFLTGMIGFISLTGHRKTFLKRFIVICAITLITNAYWLLPIGYYTIYNSSTYLNAYNNLTQTNEFILKNQKYGNISDMIFMRGFIYESGDVDTSGKQVLIFQPWIEHFKQIPAHIAYIGLFGLIVLGLILHFKKGSWETRALFSMFLVTFIFFATNIFPFSIISDIFRNYIPVFKQAFRIPFTKLAISWSLFYSIFLAIGASNFINTIGRVRIKDFSSRAIAALILLLSIGIISWPAFQGNLFYRKIHADLPDEYRELFAYFQKQNLNERIAHFPSASPTGWTLYKWGYSGSGFLWYGLPQPILDRNFDVWSDSNENFYWEASRALYAKDSVQFQDVLAKYNVHWIILDENITSISHPRSLYNEYLHQFLDNSSVFERTWKKGNISVYKYIYKTENVDLYNNVPRVSPGYKWNNYDKAYELNNIYQESKETIDSYYPFRSLFSARGRIDTVYTVYNEEKGITFLANLKIKNLPSRLIVSPIDDSESLFFDQNIQNLEENKPQLRLGTQEINLENLFNDVYELDSDKIEVFIPSFSPYNSYNSKNDIFAGSEAPCWYPDVGSINQRQIQGINENFIRYLSLNAKSCRNIALPNIEHRVGYIVGVKSRNIENIPLNMWIENLTSKHVDQQFYLGTQKDFKWEYFIIPPQSEDGLGYTLHFDNLSIGETETVNDLAEVFMYPIPYRFMTSLHFEKDQVNYAQKISNKIISSQHKSPTSYEVDVKNVKDNDSLVLWQAYNNDWKAYTFACEDNSVSCKFKKAFPMVFGQEIKTHTKINNWANGWNLSTSNDKQLTTIKIIFTPQYLQFVGYILILITFILLLLPFLKNTH